MIRPACISFVREAYNRVIHIETNTSANFQIVNRYGIFDQHLN